MTWSRQKVQHKKWFCGIFWRFLTFHTYRDNKSSSQCYKTRFTERIKCGDFDPIFGALKFPTVRLASPCILYIFVKVQTLLIVQLKKQNNVFYSIGFSNHLPRNIQVPRCTKMLEMVSYLWSSFHTNSAMPKTKIFCRVYFF